MLHTEMKVQGISPGIVAQPVGQRFDGETHYNVVSVRALLATLVNTRYPHSPSWNNFFLGKKVFAVYTSKIKIVLNS